MLTNAAIVSALLAALSPVIAHKGCGGHDVAKRNFGGPLKTHMKRQTESSEASLLDPNAECAYYTYQPVIDLESSYPEVWETASILSSDTTAQQIFSTINNTLNTKLPNNAPSGIGPSGDTSNVHYNSTDPNCWWTWRECTVPSAASGIVPDVTGVEADSWGFGFDDGPNCSHNALYDYLMEQEQKATMFYIGSNVYDWPLQALRGIDDGHEICVHTWSHQYMTSFTNDIAFAELYYTRQIIKDILGVTPTCWRPPYGDVDNRIRLIAAGLNLTTIVWSDDTDDWKAGIGGVTEQDVDDNYQGLIDSMKNGSYSTKGPVVLNHELNNYTMSEMIKWYPQIKSAFKNVVPIATALNNTHPYAEQNVTYPDFQQYTSGDINATTGIPSSTAASSSTSSVRSASGSAGAVASGSNTRAGSNVASASASASGAKSGALARLSAEIGSVVLGVMGVAGYLLL